MIYNKQKGLTLVEIAIVIVIIGLLIVSLLKGEQVITNSRIVNVINSIKSLEGVIVSFEDVYGFKPGDVDGNKVPGCDNTTNCTNILSSTIESGIVNDDLNPTTRWWYSKFSILEASCIGKYDKQYR